MSCTASWPSTLPKRKGSKSIELSFGANTEGNCPITAGEAQSVGTLAAQANVCCDKYSIFARLDCDVRVFA